MGKGSIKPETGPAALLASLTHAETDEERAACLWLADVGNAMVAVAKGLARAGRAT